MRYAIHVVPVLLLHPNRHFLKKTQQELGENHLATTSFHEAKKWIHDENVPISAIYLYPNDSSFSALELLEKTLRSRPVTPIYLFDEQNDLTRDNLGAIAKNFKVMGSLKGNVTPQALKDAFALEVPENLQHIKHRFHHASEHEGYVAVPIIDFVYAIIHATPVFIEDEKHGLRLFATAGTPVDLEYLGHAASQTSWLYIPKLILENRLNSFERATAAYLEPGYLSPSWRIAETFFRTKNLITKLKTGKVDEDVFERSYSVLQDLFQLTSQASHSQNLDRLMAQAKHCDRAIAAVTLSVLFCQKMKYSKNSMITKTLGFSSLLQDISLYQTPYGDLSEVSLDDLHGEVKNYYLNHPLKSAELLEQGGEIPEFALQVIRQQHERRDRTGFPKKIGGTQFHLVSEILSLINCYLDPNPAPDFYRHYSAKVVKTFLEVLRSIRER